MKTLHEQQLERFDEEFPLIQFDITKHSNVKSFLTQCRIEQLEKDIEQLKIMLLPTNHQNGNMTTLMYIENEGFNIEFNKRINWLLEQKQKELKKYE